MGAQAEQVFPIFIGIWIVLGLVSGAILFLNNNAQMKRSLWPPFVIGTGILFLVFMWLMGFSGKAFLIMLPLTGLITYLNLRTVRFCSACGKTLINQNFLSPPKFCSKCGAELTE